ncbi:MAG: histidine triad nucleotide-binding protein [Oscillospiraceae bacterium]|jgi:histidine triad (HIT) family protein|nr:histidine triad nucleotide-binding protein [Oscillospiraceae bacterium]
MSDCIFCKIAAGEIPSGIVYKDKNVVAFRDIEPNAPTHILVIPRFHIESADDIHADYISADGEYVVATDALVGYIFSAIPKIAVAEGLTNGYRVVTNVGADAHQSVKHLHFHLLGGTDLGTRAC